PKARGDYLVIYDAEDRPETDQLKKAIHLFSQSGKEVICLQAHLNFYNRARNILTRLFTAEYSTWFDYCLLGLFRLHAPIPLGGTSNHFKLSALRELKGWDPYNVTEDCDLGIRLYIAGYRTGLLDSTTWEEATFKIMPWIRQRSRWIKGYMQTYLVHLRQHSILVKKMGLGKTNSILVKKMGLGKTIHFHFLFGATCFCLLLNPLYWILTLLWFTVHPGFISDFFPIWIMLPALISFLAGNIAFVLSSMLGCLHRRYYDLIPYTLLMPFYWILMSIAAWKGCLQLITRPFYWEKTPHEGTAHLEETP
ncbi:MAG: glycosyltransferase family 2 protein, partial [Planctomycetota bacterium]